MCGRYTLTADPTFVQEELGLRVAPAHHPRFNIAPTQAALVVTAQRRDEATVARWGLIPPWAKDVRIASQTFNARAETIAEKPAFKDAFVHRRCLVPADGFYEWPHGQPVHLALPHRAIFTFAGLWESWRSHDGEQIDTFTIITTTANETLKGVHTRMPVLVPRALRSTWLDASVTDARALLVPWSGETISITEVGDAVGTASHEGPDCLAPPTRRQLALF
ncbi:MAG: SOS response-associated peptidase [Myxococcaceae bacterium]|nr:SOS response-associated peptidase [Myxococcaceae bacterium]